MKLYTYIPHTQKICYAEFCACFNRHHFSLLLIRQHLIRRILLQDILNSGHPARKQTLYETLIFFTASDKINGKDRDVFGVQLAASKRQAKTKHTSESLDEAETYEWYMARYSAQRDLHLFFH